MRKIKFRAWVSTDKIMERDRFYINQFDGSCHYTEPYHYEHEDDVKFYDCGEEEPIIMQYINRKDKYNREIYEDDILRNGDWIGKVVYAAPEFKFDDGKSLFSISWEDFEIIGNEYENPDLMSDRHDR